MSPLGHVLRYAFRALRRTPGFTAAAVAALALGIGATTTIFTVVNGVLLRPLQYEAPDRLVNIWNDLGQGAQSLPAVSPLDFRDYKARSRTIEDFAAAAEGNVANLRGNLTGEGAPERADLVTVTDQAGKNRKSETDALGRLTKVWENPTGLNYLTTYTYDVLDDLLTVTQTDSTTSVTQLRTFAYDSLKRLIWAANPEQGATPANPQIGKTSYQYDNNGNLTYKVDALNRSTWYGYDALNRSTGYYTNNPNTPQVVHIYDTSTLGKGRLGYSYTSSYWVGCTSSDYLTMTPIDSYDALGRPLVQRQHYWNGSGWGNTYQVSRTYDLAGNVKSQTYPSGRVVNYDYNTAGQMSSFVPFGAVHAPVKSSPGSSSGEPAPAGSMPAGGTRSS